MCEARRTQAQDLKAYVDEESLTPGEVVGNGYVLQELLMDLGTSPNRPFEGIGRVSLVVMPT